LFLYLHEDENGIILLGILFLVHFRENIFGRGGEVAEEYAVLIKALWCGQYKSISPRDFKVCLSTYDE